MRKLKSEIEIKLDDGTGERTFTLRYDLNALSRFEDMYDKSILEVFGPSINDEGQMIVNADGTPRNVKFRVSMLRDLIWVGLVARHPEMTQEKVGEMLDPAEAERIFSSSLVDAVGASNQQKFPQEKKVGRTERPKK